MKLLLGDCIDKLKELDDNSIDSIVTDPPYGLSFMGKKWDYDVPSQEIFEECLRVLKPGGHLLSFAGSRTYHRMAVRVEDVGFEIRDQIMWIYGSGFPKSHNIGKKLDEWEGWGTALKPAHEPIVMARKPLSEKTIVDNVLEWGTGGINIDESRVGTEERTYDLKGGENLNKLSREGKGDSDDAKSLGAYGFGAKQISIGTKTVEGRFPANIIFDEEAGKILDEQSEGGASRFFYCPKTSKKDRDEGLDEFEDKQTVGGGGGIGDYKNDVNSASGKAPSKNNHPTVKPTDLMLYLIRLVTPKGGTTLDPFMGSGSSGKAAIRGGFDFIGIEREEEYMEIAQARIQYEIDNPYNEETKTRTEVKSEVKETVNKFFSF